MNNMISSFNLHPSFEKRFIIQIWIKREWKVNKRLRMKEKMCYIALTSMVLIAPWKTWAFVLERLQHQTSLSNPHQQYMSYPCFWEFKLKKGQIKLLTNISISLPAAPAMQLTQNGRGYSWPEKVFYLHSQDVRRTFSY